MSFSSGSLSLSNTIFASKLKCHKDLLVFHHLFDGLPFHLTDMHPLNNQDTKDNPHSVGAINPNISQ